MEIVFIFIVKGTKMAEKQREPYKTKQKDLVADILKKQRKDFTAKELFAKLVRRDASIGLTTIYRILQQLVQDGEIIKLPEANGTIYYRVVKECHKKGHCFLKCESCGRIIHSDCELFNELSDHLKDRHHFLIEKKNMTIYGNCERCQKNGK